MVKTKNNETITISIPQNADVGSDTQKEIARLQGLNNELIEYIMLIVGSDTETLNKILSSYNEETVDDT